MYTLTAILLQVSRGESVRLLALLVFADPRSTADLLSFQSIHVTLHPPSSLFPHFRWPSATRLQIPVHNLHKRLHELLQSDPILLTKRTQALAIHIQHSNHYISHLHRHDNLTLRHAIASNVSRPSFNIGNDDRLASEECRGADAYWPCLCGFQGDAVAGWAAVKGTEDES